MYSLVGEEDTFLCSNYCLLRAHSLSHIPPADFTKNVHIRRHLEYEMQDVDTDQLSLLHLYREIFKIFCYY